MNSAFKHELRTLSREDRMIYCIHMAKRLWPDYIRFYEIENFGDVLLINDILQVAEAFIKQGINMTKTYVYSVNASIRQLPIQKIFLR